MPGRRRGAAEKSGRELVGLLDAEVSLNVRMSAADDNGWVCCPTCGRINKWNDGVDWSHYISRANFNVRWDPRNSIAQCAYENRFREGNHAEMIDVLTERWGGEEIAQMRALAKLPNKRPDDEWLRTMIAEYRRRNKALRARKSLA